MVSLNLNEGPVFTRPEILNTGGVPSPLYGVNPRTIMGPERWDVLRRRIYTWNNFCCFACGVPRVDAKYHQWLEAHEIYDIDWEKGRMELREVVALCPACHSYIHAGRLYNTGPRKKLEDVLKRGLLVLEEAGLKPLEGHAHLAVRVLGPRYLKYYLLPGGCVRIKPPRVIAPRSNWRLIFEGVEYPPLPLRR